MTEIDYALLLRQWADVAPMGGECAVVLRAAADDWERLRGELAELRWPECEHAMGTDWLRAQFRRILKERDEAQTTLDSVLVRDEQSVHRDVVTLREKLHSLRGLLATACEAYRTATTSHQAGSVTWLAPAWYDRAMALTREE